MLAAARSLSYTPNTGARSVAIDPNPDRLYLPSAMLAEATPGGRPAPVAGTFEFLDVGSP